jgi:hypothetical protein
MPESGFVQNVVAFDMIETALNYFRRDVTTRRVLFCTNFNGHKNNGQNLHVSDLFSILSQHVGNHQ